MGLGEEVRDRMESQASQGVPGENGVGTTKDEQEPWREGSQWEGRRGAWQGRLTLPPSLFKEYFEKLIEQCILSCNLKNYSTVFTAVWVLLQLLVVEFDSFVTLWTVAH